MRKSILIFVLFVLAMSAFGQGSAQVLDEPKTVAESLEAIKKFRTELIRQNYEAFEENEDVAKVVGQKVTERAKEYSLRFQPDDVRKDELLGLARLYVEAAECDKVRDAVSRRLAEPGLTSSQRAALLLDSIDVGLTTGGTEKCKDILALVDDSVGKLEAMGDEFVPQQVKAYRQAQIIFSKDENRLEKAGNRYIELYKKLSPADRSSNLRFGLYKAYTNLARIHARRGNRDRATQTFRDGVQLLSGDPDAASTLSMLKYDQGRFELPGKKAAPIEAEYWINRKPSDQPLELTGNVTLLEFTAHWCVPCKQSYPAMMRLHKKYAERGVDIVLVTTLYGYFGKDRNLTPEQEFAKDKRYYAEELGLPFKVAVKTPYPPGSPGPGADKNSRSYFSQAIPQWVVVDRKGIVTYASTELRTDDIETVLSRVIEDALKKPKD